MQNDNKIQVQRREWNIIRSLMVIIGHPKTSN